PYADTLAPVLHAIRRRTTSMLRRTRVAGVASRVWPGLTPLDARWQHVRACGVFDAKWYRTAYPDVRAAVDPLRHYATRGWREGRDPNPLFSTSWYLTTYPDIAAAGANPLLHYVEHGVAEGRDPGPGFDTTWYLSANADVRVARLNPLGHYLRAGMA